MQGLDGCLFKGEGVSELHIVFAHIRESHYTDNLVCGLTMVAEVVLMGILRPPLSHISQIRLCQVLPDALNAQLPPPPPPPTTTTSSNGGSGGALVVLMMVVVALVVGRICCSSSSSSSNNTIPPPLRKLSAP